MNVTDDMADAALVVLNDTTHGEARARYEKLTRERRRLLARLERESGGKTQRDRETYAQTHPHLLALDEELTEIEQTYFVAKDRRDSAAAVIEAWRTIQANARAAERIR